MLGMFVRFTDFQEDSKDIGCLYYYCVIFFVHNALLLSLLSVLVLLCWKQRESNDLIESRNVVTVLHNGPFENIEDKVE